MAIDDLDTLKTHLPEVFSSIPLPPGWDTDWRVVKVADPESSTPQGAEGELNQEVDASLGPSDSPDWSVPRRPVFSSTEQFPGSPQAGSGGSIPPPPDAFAFYLPFHFFHPQWWGIYIVREPALQGGKRGHSEFLSQCGLRMTRWQVTSRQVVGNK